VRANRKPDNRKDRAPREISIGRIINHHWLANYKQVQISAPIHSCWLGTFHISHSRIKEIGIHWISDPLKLKIYAHSFSLSRPSSVDPFFPGQVHNLMAMLWYWFRLENDSLLLALMQHLYAFESPIGWKDQFATYLDHHRRILIDSFGFRAKGWTSRGCKGERMEE
jgi:hypothetical protein